VAGVALGDIDLLFCVAGVALVALGFLWWRAWAPLVARDAAALLRFAWQVWRLATSTFVLRGRRSTWRHPPSFGVASVALVALGWLWWRAWAPLVARHAAALCVAGVALAHMNFRFAWQVWHLATSTFVLRVRRGTWRHRPSFGVASVAFGDIHAASESISLKYDVVTHNFVTHNLSHLSLSCNFIAQYRTQLCQTQLFRTQLFHTPLSHTTLSPTTLSHTTLSHTTLSHTTLSPTTLSPTTLSHTFFVTRNSFTHNLFTHISLTHNFVAHNFVTHNL